MKRKKVVIAVCAAVLMSMTMQSCIGSFALTNKVLSWNKHVSNKFVNELVFFAFWILPVYEVTGAADLLVINSIEFWSGNNPLEANNQIIETPEGNYKILANKKGYKVICPDGNTYAFDYDISSQTWSFDPGTGVKTDFLRFKDENHVEMINHDGNFVDVELSRDGIEMYRHLMEANLMALQ